MLHFKIMDLEQADLAQAWPLVRAADPGIGLVQWETLGDALIKRGGGIVGVAGEAGGLLGVATYEAVDKPRVGRVLQVDMIVAFELTRRPRIRSILCEELDEMVPRMGCSALAVSVPKANCAADGSVAH